MFVPAWQTKISYLLLMLPRLHDESNDDNNDNCDHAAAAANHDDDDGGDDASKRVARLAISAQM